MHQSILYLAVAMEKSKRNQELLQAVEQKSASLHKIRKATGWLGTQMVTWGAKLQNFDTPHRHVVANTNSNQ